MSIGSHSYGSTPYGTSNPGDGIVNYTLPAEAGSFSLRFTELPAEEEQAGYNVYGYINNPRWTQEAEYSDIHKPCGYWFKGEENAPECGPIWTLP